MTLARYESYKDSGVEWLGEVPQGWTVARLKFIASVQTGVAKGKDNVGKDTVEVPYLRVANVQDGYLSLDDVATIQIPAENLQRYALKAGDVLMNEGGDFDKLGRGHVWQGEIEPCIHQNHVFAVRPATVGSDWLNTVTGSDYAQFYFMSRSKQSTNLASISSTNVMELPVIVPPADQQKAILTFLSIETGKIDALVAEQERLITILKEKRQAVISHAVTKGLNPDAPMKDSGIEWLGEVPESWEVLQFTRVIGRIEQGWSPVASSESCEPDNWGVLKLGAIKNGEFIAGENKMLLAGIDPDPALEVKPGDLLLTRGNTPELVGDACVVTEFVGYRLMLSDLVYRILLKPNNEPNFFCNLLISKYGRSLIETDARGSSMSMAKISQGHIGSWIIPVPPPEEQSAIVAFINAETARIDALLAEAQRAIDLLKERRIALISTAVTGKIDVRGLVVTKSE
ncbi:type I restriction-modification protein subunit S [Geomonas sp. Red276]